MHLFFMTKWWFCLVSRFSVFHTLTFRYGLWRLYMQTIRVINVNWMRYSTLEGQFYHEVHVWDAFVTQFVVFEMFVVCPWCLRSLFCVFGMCKKFGQCLWDVWEVCFVFLRCLFEMFAQSGNWHPIPIIATTIPPKIHTPLSGPPGVRQNHFFWTA